MATSGRLLSCWCPVSSAQTSRNGQCQHFEFVKQSAEPVPSTKSTNCCPLAPWSPLRPHSHFTGLRSQNAMQLWHVQIRFSKDAWDTWGGWCSWYGWGGWGGWGGCWAAAFGASKLYAAKLEGSHVLRSRERRLSTVLVFLVALREPGWTTAQAHINHSYMFVRPNHWMMLLHLIIILWTLAIVQKCKPQEACFTPKISRNRYWNAETS